MSEVQYSDGKPAELLVETVFRDAGWLITPARMHRIEHDSAPLFLGDDEKVIMPDVYAMGSGGAIWAEVKQFTEPVPTRKRSQKEHGVRSRKLADYKRTAELSGHPVWLFIFEEDTGQLLAADVDDVTKLPPINREACIAHYGEVVSFFARDEFTKILLRRRYAEKEHLPDNIDTSDGDPLSEVLSDAE